MRLSLLTWAVVLTLGGPAVLRKKDGWARVGKSAAEIRISGFIDSPCPKGARCVWSGQSVSLEYRVDGATVAATAWPYELKVVASDYKTKATVLATERPEKTP